MPKHTSLPWAVREVYEDGIVVSRGIEDVHGVGLNKGSEFELFDKDTAEFIVKACNSYDDLLEACEKAEQFLEGIISFYGQGLEVANWHLNGSTEPFDNFIEDNSDGTELEILRKAIAKAKGELTCQNK